MHTYVYVYTLQIKVLYNFLDLPLIALCNVHASKIFTKGGDTETKMLENMFYILVSLDFQFDLQ